jgi:uncharacterized protein (UPF0210 family)
MSKAPIRTITIGIDTPHPLPTSTVLNALSLLEQARARYTDLGYEVQTLRLSTRPLLSDLGDWSTDALFAYAQQLQRVCSANELDYCSLGPVDGTQSSSLLKRLDLVADLLIANPSFNMTVQLASARHGLDAEGATATARVMQRLAQETDEGFGNFRFAMLACVQPGTPFFPAAYHDGPMSLSLGLQSAGSIAEALSVQNVGNTVPLAPAQITAIVREAVLTQAQPAIALAQQFAQEQHLLFGGIDLSPAPMGKDSLVAALEQCNNGGFGSVGTLTLVAAFTAALRSIELPTCGYNGLMFPVLEDAVLGERWAQGRVDVQRLLLYSAVCGTGLDTIPLAGDTPIELLARLLLDVASLALRYQKPLSARLFPVPGKVAGEMTSFSSPYLVNTVVGAL